MNSSNRLYQVVVTDFDDPDEATELVDDLLERGYHEDQIDVEWTGDRDE